MAAYVIRKYGAVPSPEVAKSTSLSDSTLLTWPKAMIVAHDSWAELQD